MEQCALNRAVAKATGETVERIQRIGFSLLVPSPSLPKRRRHRRRRPLLLAIGGKQ